MSSEIPTPPSGLGHPVTMADVAIYAKPGHSCRFSRFGPGTIAKYKVKEKDPTPDNCQCAVRRFKLANYTKVEILTLGKDVQIRWKPDCEPA